ncbi:MAG TPA: hypothetical protein VJ929_14805 [Roseovarius sp.]|nr:hypothetical protein [Roseovarius sp.]
MTWLKKRLSRFRDDTRGTVTVEAVIIVPILFWAVTATWEFFELYRFKSVREKASYVVVDMISREQNGITETYLDNTLSLYDDVVREAGNNQIRVSSVMFRDNDPNIDTDDEYVILWSEVRGEGPLEPIKTSEIKDGADFIPKMADQGTLIMIQTLSLYHPNFKVGLAANLPVDTHVFTSPRFVAQVNCTDCTS